MMRLAAAENPPGSLGKTVFWLTLGTVALAPLPFGSNRPWSWSLLIVLAGALLVVWSVDHLRTSKRLAVAPWRIALPGLLFAATCIYAFVQTLAIFPDWVVHPLWSLGTAVRPSTGLATVSLSPTDSRTALFRTLSYGIFFWLVLQASRKSHRADQAIGVMGMVAGAYSAYGLLVFLTGNESILWFDKWAYFDSVTSTFVNRNSFATYTGLGLLCAVAYLFRALGGAQIDQTSLRHFFSGLLGRMTPWIMGSLASIPLNFAAMFLTQSRAGIISSTLALIVFLIGLSLKLRARRRTVLFLSALTMSALVYYFVVSGSGFIDRLDTLIGSDLSNNARLIVYQATISGILEAPWLGVGYGTYEDFFRSIRSPEMPARFIRAHNTYLENALELGIPAAASLVASIALLARRALAGLRRQRSVFVYGWMAFCATILVGVHALVDFSLQIPAIAITYAAILAVGCSQSWSSRIDTSQ